MSARIRPIAKAATWTLLPLLLLAGCTSGGGSSTAGEPRPGRSDDRDVVTEPVGDWFESACALPRELLGRVRRGFDKQRSPDVLFVPREPNFFGGFRVTSHSGPWDYVQRVPLVFYGPGFVRSGIELSPRDATVADLAPTLAELLDVPFPDRPGKSLPVFLPEGERAGKPRLIFVVVWDGGGWNVLEQWPDAWPYLRKLMEKGASVRGVTVGSSPSVTPAIHTNIGTGAFPKQHGIVDIPMREGDAMVAAFRGRSPRFLRLTTLADVYDQQVGNAGQVGVLAYKMWHVGMIGHGAYLEGGDKDIAVLVQRDAKLATNAAYYLLPPYLSKIEGLDEDIKAVDIEDGKADGKWMGHEVLDDATELRDTPAWVLHQTRLLEAMIEREGFGDDDVPDLLFTNYKQIDEVGHLWNMVNEEMREIIRYTDDAFRDLTSFLDETVGKREWVVVYTADHGQAPSARSTGAWPIHMGVLRDSLGRHFDVDPDDLLLDERPVGFWLDDQVMDANGITEEEIAQFLTTYRLEDNVAPGEEIPSGYEDRSGELIFSAGWPGDEMGRVWACARRK